MCNLDSILQNGLSPGVISGQSGATDLQMSPAFPFDGRVPSRTQACGRTGSLEYNLLVVLDHPR
eukprot:10487311-Lingulodinium_polyedra.AAC.1